MALWNERDHCITARRTGGTWRLLDPWLVDRFPDRCAVHDTIVVFDRVRENMQRRTSETFEQVVNASLVQTMARSLNTSLTVLFTLLALTLFGSSTSVHIFTLTLLIGILSGTYSSIFNASMLLVMWDKGEMGFGLFNREAAKPVTKREARELARTRG